MDLGMDKKLGRLRRWYAFTFAFTIGLALWWFGHFGATEWHGWALLAVAGYLLVWLSAQAVPLLVLHAAIGRVHEPIPFWESFFAAHDLKRLREFAEDAKRDFSELERLARGIREYEGRNLTELIWERGLTQARIIVSAAYESQRNKENKLLKRGVDIGLRPFEVQEILDKGGYAKAKAHIEKREFEYFADLFTQAKRYDCYTEVREALDSRGMLAAEEILHARAREALEHGPQSYQKFGEGTFAEG